MQLLPLFLHDFMVFRKEQNQAKMVKLMYKGLQDVKALTWMTGPELERAFPLAHNNDVISPP